jgi:hypothetical protein
VKNNIYWKDAVVSQFPIIKTKTSWTCGGKVVWWNGKDAVRAYWALSERMAMDEIHEE